MKLAKIDSVNSKGFDRLKWLLAVVVLTAGLFANYFYSYHPWPYRLIVGLVLLSVVALIILQTQQGRQVLSFTKESRVELRKVFWPTRQETMQTTLVVAVMVVVLALLLWGIDSVLVWLIGWLTGQRG